MAAPKLSIRKDRKNEAGECMVIARYRAKGESSPLRLSTEIYIQENYFQDGVINGYDLHTRRLKQKELDDFLIRLNGIIDGYKKEGILEPTGKQVKERYDDLYSTKKEETTTPVIEPIKVKLSPFEAFEKYINDSDTGVRLLDGKHISNGTLKNYKSAKNILEGFIEEKMKEETESNPFNLKWEHINYQFYLNFCNYCWYDLNHFDNNLGKYITRLRAFLNYCVDEEIIEKPIYNKKKWIIYKEKDVDSMVLLPHEIFALDELTKQDLKGCIKGFETKNLLMLSIFTCLRVSDLMLLNKYCFKESAGQYTLDLSQVKTSGRVKSIPLPKIANKYIKWVLSEDFKKVSDQYYNRNLKHLGKWFKRFMIKNQDTFLKKDYILSVDWNEKFRRIRFRKKAKVEELVDIENMFTTHMGRRSGITMYLIKGYQNAMVQAISGHSSAEQMLDYERHIQRFIGRDTTELFKKLDIDSGLV